MIAIATYVNRPSDPAVDSWTAGLRDELSDLGGVIHRIVVGHLPHLTAEAVAALQDGRRKIAVRIERLRNIGPESIRALTVHEALALLEGREFPVDALPPGYDVDLLQVLDRDGFIEVRYWTWNRSDEAKPFEQPSVWFSPLKCPGMAGPWDQIYANTKRNDQFIPCDVRLSGLGKAELAKWRRQQAGITVAELKPVSAAAKPAQAKRST